jgi:hypothetical protein
MPRWTIAKEWSAGPSPDRDTKYAIAYALTMNDAETQTTIEWARGANGSSAEGRTILRPYLKNEKPPRRLIVDREGGVSEHEE